MDVMVAVRKGRRCEGRHLLRGVGLPEDPGMLDCVQGAGRVAPGSKGEARGTHD